MSGPGRSVFWAEKACPKDLRWEERAGRGKRPGAGSGRGDGILYGLWLLCLKGLIEMGGHWAGELEPDSPDSFLPWSLDLPQEVGLC